MKHDRREIRREHKRYLDSLPPPDAAFLEAARNAVVRAGILPWEEFKKRYEEEHAAPKQDVPEP